MKNKAKEPEALRSPQHPQDPVVCPLPPALSELNALLLSPPPDLAPFMLHLHQLVKVPSNLHDASSYDRVSAGRYVSRGPMPLLLETL